MQGRLILVLIQILILGVSDSHSQGVVSSASNTVEHRGIVSYTIGYLSYTTESESLGTLTSAIGQLGVSDVITSIDAETEGIKVLAYPNPTNHTVHVKLDHSRADIGYSLCSIDGSILKTGSWLGLEHAIDLSVYGGSFFLLNLSIRGKIFKRLKVIKQ